MTEPASKPPSWTVSANAHRAVRRALDYAAQMTAAGRWLEINPDAMAAAAGYGRGHFNDLFRGVTGISPGRYLQGLRFEEARQLLRSTDLTQRAICRRIGYQSPNKFGERFRQLYGVAAGRYRKGAEPRAELLGRQVRNCLRHQRGAAA